MERWMNRRWKGKRGGKAVEDTNRRRRDRLRRTRKLRFWEEPPSSVLVRPLPLSWFRGVAAHFAFPIRVPVRVVVVVVVFFIIIIIIIVILLLLIILFSFFFSSSRAGPTMWCSECLGEQTAAIPRRAKGGRLQVS